MKRQVIIWTVYSLTTIMFSVNTYGQCRVDAGTDTALCISFMPDTFHLGSSPTVKGGTPPYTYTWSCTDTTINFTFTASDFLDDTTIANPQLIGYAENGLTFYLSVSDGAGNNCNDSISIRFSNWIWTLDDKTFYINQGDSIKLYKSVHGGIPPITYLWSPSTGLTDPTDVYTWAKPDTTTFYTLLATDSVGCHGGDNFKVYVNTTGLTEHDQSQIKLDIYPNPLIDRSTIKTFSPRGHDLTIDFYDTFGRTIKKMNISGTETEINRTDFTAGIYFYRLFDNDRPVGQGKLIIE